MTSLEEVLCMNDFQGHSAYAGSGGGENALDWTQASRNSSRFGERKAPSIPGLSAMWRTTVLTIASVVYMCTS